MKSGELLQASQSSAICFMSADISGQYIRPCARRVMLSVPRCENCFELLCGSNTIRSINSVQLLGAGVVNRDKVHSFRSFSAE